MKVVDRSLETEIRAFELLANGAVLRETAQVEIAEFLRFVSRANLLLQRFAVTAELESENAPYTDTESSAFQEEGASGP